MTAVDPAAWIASARQRPDAATAGPWTEERARRIVGHAVYREHPENEPRDRPWACSGFACAWRGASREEHVSHLADLLAPVPAVAQDDAAAVLAEPEWMRKPCECASDELGGAPAPMCPRHGMEAGAWREGRDAALAAAPVPTVAPEDDDALVEAVEDAVGSILVNAPDTAGRIARTVMAVPALRARLAPVPAVATEDEEDHR